MACIVTVASDTETPLWLTNGSVGGEHVGAIKQIRAHEPDSDQAVGVAGYAP